MKIAIITGTSQGLGQALFDGLIARNFFVVSVSRRFSESQLADEKEKKCLLINADLNKLSNKLLEKKLAPLAKDLKKAKVYYFNNAFMLLPGPVGKLEEQDIQAAASVNIFAPFLMVNFILQAFKSNQLHFINISSGAAKHAITGWPLYCATKAANDMFFDVLKKQNDKLGVYNIDPGVIDTGMQQQVRKLSKSAFPQVDIFRNYEKTGRLNSSAGVALNIFKQLGI